MDDSRDVRCPECGADLDGTRTCPDCGLEIRTEDDELTEAAATAVIDGALADASRIQPSPDHAVPYSLRLAVALAISIPFVPLSAFVLTSIVTAHPISVVVIGVSSWMAPAAILARATVPSLVVGRGLVVLGLVVAASPLVVVLGRTFAGEAAAPDPLIDGSGTLIGSFLVFGVIVLGLGIVVSRVAIRKREDWREADAVGGSDGRN